MWAAVGGGWQLIHMEASYIFWSTLLFTFLAFLIGVGLGSYIEGTSSDPEKRYRDQERKDRVRYARKDRARTELREKLAVFHEIRLCIEVGSRGFSDEEQAEEESIRKLKGWTLVELWEHEEDYWKAYRPED